LRRLPVGTCTSEHTKEYFESTLPLKPPKIHLGSIWSTYGPYSQKKLSLDENESISNGTRAISNESKGVSAPLMQTFVSLSQTATTNNSQYLDQSDDFGLLDDTLLDDGEGNESESHGEEELDTSMVTYLSKSPDHQFEKKKLVEETRIALKKMSVMLLCKPQLETIFNMIGNDAELVVEFQDHLSKFLADAMAKNISRTSHMESCLECSLFQ
jgi:hypothetical protein